jgi:hypothetical protein
MGMKKYGAPLGCCDLNTPTLNSKDVLDDLFAFSNKSGKFMLHKKKTMNQKMNGKKKNSPES